MRYRGPSGRRPPLSTPESWAVIDALSEAQAGALHRQQLTRAGVPRWVVRCELRARRWQRLGTQVVVTHNGPMEDPTRWWAAVLQVGRRAALDGVTALQAAGASGLGDRVLHVITPKSSTPVRARGAVVHESRRFCEEDVIGAGVRRVRPAVAAVHAALWARTDREASYVMLLVVQQRLATPEQLAEAVAAVRRHPRRRLLRQLVEDVGGGVHTLGELDVARDFRRRGLPEPERQVVRQRPDGRQYLDCRLAAYRLTLEIDGVGHEDPDQRLADLLRDLALMADGDAVVRLPLVVYRRDRERVLDAFAALLRSRGWPGEQAAA